MSEKSGMPQGSAPPSEPPPSYSAYPGQSNPAYSAPQYGEQPQQQQQYGMPQQQYGMPPQQYGMPQQPQQYGMQQQPQQYGMQQQTNVVVNQPGVNYSAVHTNAPDNMGLAIFATICCFWPLGIVAIMRASEARNALTQGDMNGAVLLSAQSRRLSLWAVACGCISIVLIIVIVVAYVVTYNNSSCYDCY
ncbi:proline-rich transmembrane protein 1-like [Haliotis cracherodii]|uniref:proline-rich transmembrane protein 1-like n=1 Tax=Haliotis cracherodii TaxID=6455 RepID=UPI0039E789A2